MYYLIIPFVLVIAIIFGAYLSLKMDKRLSD